MEQRNLAGGRSLHVDRVHSSFGPDQLPQYCLFVAGVRHYWRKELVAIADAFNERPTPSLSDSVRRGSGRMVTTSPMRCKAIGGDIRQAGQDRWIDR
jgi:hypothetical protein